MKQTLLKLLKELPPDTVVARYMTPNGVYTAARMIDEVEEGSEIGMQWGSDLLRVSRDLLIRQSTPRQNSNQVTKD